MKFEVWDDFSLRFWFKWRLIDWFFLDDHVDYSERSFHLKVGKFYIECPAWLIDV